jgi:hypothetical protein
LDKPTIQFTKKLLPLEPRRSQQVSDVNMVDLRNAVVTAARVSRFYYDHIHEVRGAGANVNIMPRDATQILAQMKNQQLYICEQIDIPEPKIVAASILWELEAPVVSEDGFCGYEWKEYLEIGTQVSALNGYQLQWVLAAVTLLERLSYDPTGTVFAATYGDNAQAASNFLNRMRFVRWDMLPPTLESQRLGHIALDGADQLARGVNWFRPTINTINAAAELVLDLHENPNRSARQGFGGAVQPVPEITFEFHQPAFQLAGFDVLLHIARRIVAAKPQTLDALKEAVENLTVSDDFISW